MQNFKIIPIGFILPFIIFIIIEYLIIFGLNSYQQKIDAQIASLEAKIKAEEAGLPSELAKNEAYQIFSQFVNIIEILKKRKSAFFVFNKITPLIPKFVEVKKVAFDADSDELILEGSVNDWLNYIRLYHYFSSQPDLILIKFASPKFDPKTQKVDFEFTFKLKPTFYQR